MDEQLRIPDDYRIFTPLEDHLFEVCKESTPVHGVLYFIDHENSMLAVASSRTESDSELEAIRLAVKKVERPCRIAEVHPYVSHGQFFLKPVPLYFSVKPGRVLYVADNRPKADVVEQIPSVSSSRGLEDMVHEIRTALTKALTGSTAPHVSGSLATRRSYGRLPHSVVE